MFHLPASQLKLWLMRFFAMLLPFCLVLLLEGVSRAGAYVWHDYSEYYLLYGFHNYAGRVGVSAWWTDTGKHYKFPPGYVLRHAAGQGGETATINARGFRGPDFVSPKPEGTFRIVCLGESSTFGFYNGDTETYPYQLEKALREGKHSVRVEVINGGFPYYNSGSILSLLQSEILGYDPDVITIYSAYNDASWPLHVGAVSRLATWFQEHSMLYLLMKEHVLDEGELLRWKGRFVRHVLRQGDTQDSFKAQTPQIVARYRKNVEAMIAVAKARGIRVIVIKQPMTSKLTEIQAGQYLKSYDEEHADVMRRFAANEDLSPIEFQLLTQHRLVQEIEAISKENDVELVDNVAVVDENRRLMASYVHLTAEANARLAKALRPVIERHLPGPARQ